MWIQLQPNILGGANYNLSVLHLFLLSENISNIYFVSYFYVYSAEQSTIMIVV